MVKPNPIIAFHHHSQLWNETRELRLKLGSGHSSDFVFRCQLNDAFGLILQGILAFTAFCILIVKRHREPSLERRPVNIWFYDTSKQAIGAVIVHFANVFLANHFQGDPCTWYFINFLLDTTIGLIIIWLCIRITSILAKLKGWRSLSFGEYGNPPQLIWWFKQCLVYILVMFIEKSIIVLLVQLSFWDDVRKFILTPFKYHPKLEAGFVMLIVPFIMNVSDTEFSIHCRISYNSCDKSLGPSEDTFENTVLSAFKPLHHAHAISLPRTILFY